MKRFAVLLATVGLCAALPPGATRDKTFTGTIYDNRCADGVCAVGRHVVVKAGAIDGNILKVVTISLSGSLNK